MSPRSPCSRLRRLARARTSVGDSAGDTTPTARDSFKYGPNGQRYYKKTEWMVGANLWTEETFYAGTFEERVLEDADAERRRHYR